VTDAGNFLFINMAIDMVESLFVAFNPAGEHDDNLSAKAASVLLLQPASYMLGVAKIVHLILIRNIM